ncbi:MAG: hypothetical protein ACR2GA_02180 [Chloroflexota bacterium]
MVAIIVGGVGTFFDPALNASLPVLAGDKRTLQATNGLMDATKRLARAVASALAGLLVYLLPLGHFLTIDAVSFAISALAILSLGTRFAWRAELQTSTRGLHGSSRQRSPRPDWCVTIASSSTHWPARPLVTASG